MVLLIHTMRKQERKVQRYYLAFPSSSSPEVSSSSPSHSGGAIYQETISASLQRKITYTQKTQRTTTQALLYIGAFFTTFIFAVLFQLVYASSKKIITWLYLLQLTTAPAQGLLNFLVYIRPKVQNIKRNNPELSSFAAFMNAIKSKDCATTDKDNNSRGSTSREGVAEARLQPHIQEMVDARIEELPSLRSTTMAAHRILAHHHLQDNSILSETSEIEEGKKEFLSEIMSGDGDSDASDDENSLFHSENQSIFFTQEEKGTLDEPEKELNTTGAATYQKEYCGSS